MNRLSLVALTSLSFTFTPSLFAQQTPSSPFHQSGWTIASDSATGEIVVSHDSLGTVMTRLKLNLSVEQGLQPIHGWTVHAASPTRLLFRTTSIPMIGWQFDVEPNLLQDLLHGRQRGCYCRRACFARPHRLSSTRPERCAGKLERSSGSAKRLWRLNYPQSLFAPV